MGLVVEASNDGGDWRPVCILHPGDPEGSFSTRGPDGRDVILFRCEQARSVVYRSAGGVDTETGAGPHRIVMSSGEDTLAVLPPGESFEMPITTDRGFTGRMRWRHEAPR